MLVWFVFSSLVTTATAETSSDAEEFSIYTHTHSAFTHTLTLTIHDVQSDDLAHFSVSSLVSGFTGDRLSLTQKESNRRGERGSGWYG